MASIEESHSRQRRQLSASTARRRTTLLALGLVLACAWGLSRLDLSGAPEHPHILHWWSIALLAIAAELMVFHVEFRKEFYTFTFSEIPLLLGLFLAAPRELIIGRLVGEALFLVLKQRQKLYKLVLNLASFLAEMTVLLAVHLAFGCPMDLAAPSSWLAAFAAVAAADLVGYLIVFQAVRWHGAPITFGSILGIGALTIPVNTSFALVVAILVTDQPWATLLLTGVGAFLLLAYRSYNALSQRYDSLSMLYEFTRLVGGANRPDSVLESILTQAKDLMRAERAEIWLTDENGFRLRLQVDDNERTTGELDTDCSDGMHRWLSTTGDAILAKADRADAHRSEMIAAFDARNLLAAPIIGSGAVVGLIAVVNRLGDGAEFAEADRTMFATLANHAGVALENGRLLDRLHHEAAERQREAMHDALTGLPNRMFFGIRVADALEACAAGEQLTVAIMDLDGFKEINDTLGHQSGDLVLIEVAKRIRYAAEESAVVARLGGDEFAVMVPGRRSHADLDALARRIQAEVSNPIHANGIRMNVHISVGFAIAPKDGTHAATLLQRADVAMYRAKAGNGIAFYEAVNDDNSTRRLALGSDLRSAIADGQLKMMFQPKVRLADGVMIGAEALVRWHHPTLGRIMPDEFIPLAERTGAINALTEFVLRDSVQQLKVWREAGHHWSVAVNVAVRNLTDTDFVATVTSLLNETGVEPKALTIEITETSVMADTAKTIDVLDGLAALGVSLSVDDFGTGYSSLSYLQQLPVNEVKIDKSFVMNMLNDSGAEAIVRSVLDLARNLRLRTVAEGVEDRATLDRLRTLGCDLAQGYYLSRPISPEDLEQWPAQLASLQLDSAPRRGARPRLVVAG